MEDTDFPEYGRQCELKEPWRGYRCMSMLGDPAIVQEFLNE